MNNRKIKSPFLPILPNIDAVTVSFVTATFQLKSNYDKAKVRERKTCGRVQFSLKLLVVVLKLY